MSEEREREREPIRKVEDIEDWEEEVLFSADRFPEEGRGGDFRSEIASAAKEFFSDELPGKTRIKDREDAQKLAKARTLMKSRKEFYKEDGITHADSIDIVEEQLDEYLLYLTSIEGISREEVVDILISGLGGGRGNRNHEDATGAVNLFLDDVTGDDE